MKSLGLVRMYFTGEDGSMGYHNGKQYALEIYDTNLLSKALDHYSLWIVDLNAEGRPCPYSSVVTFLMNWSDQKPE